jgi:hypothetical protein
VEKKRGRAIFWWLLEEDLNPWVCLLDLVMFLSAKKVAVELLVRWLCGVVRELVTMETSV